MSLRARLSLVTVVIGALALLAANVAVYELVGHYLDNRLDDRIESLANPATRSLLEGGVPSGGVPSGGEDRRLPASRGSLDVSGAYAEVLSGSGSLLAKGFVLADPRERHPPQLPSSELHVGIGHTRFFDTTAPGPDGPLPYRVRVSALPGDLVVVTALPATDLHQTKHQIVLIELFVSLAVVGLGLILTWWLVGLGLRPLRRIETTAERIAEGDLSQRVEPSGSRTEIDRLGSSLNAMLVEIESAFAAKEVSEHKLRRFVADASHELRTPLTSIRGYAELLRRGADADPDERLAAARRIEQEAMRMGVLVEDLLLLARLDEGVPLEQRPVDLARLAEDLAQDARVVEPTRAITVDAPSPVTVTGDPDRLAQVVSNLVANARAYTPAGTPIELQVRRDDGHAQIAVVDHGPGIDPEAVSRVFDRFWRADDSRSRTSGGTGLGLAIVAAVAAAHGGRCGVAETPGGGATFTLELPVDGVAPEDHEVQPEVTTDA